MNKIIFANPIAGNKLAAKLTSDTFTIITDLNQYDTAIQAITSETHIIVAGGDGTVHLILNKLFNAKKLKHIKFSVLPMGTGNDLARGLGCDNITLDDFSNNTYEEKTIPLWRMTRHTKTQTEQRIFINFIGIGLDAKIVALAEKLRFYRHRLVTQFIYALAGIRYCCYRLPKNTTLTTDQGHITCHAGIILANNNSYANGCRIGESTKIFSGKLNVFLLKSWFNLVCIMFTRANKNKPYPINHQTTQATITGKNLPIQLDGEALPIYTEITTVTIERSSDSLQLFIRA